MKIALIAPTSLPSRRANTIQVMKMAQALQGKGHAVTVLAKPESPDLPAWPDLAAHYGLHEPFSIEWLEAAPVLRGYDFGLRAVERARRLGADMVYTRHPQAAALASTGGLPTILETHDLPGGKMGPFLMERFLGGKGARRLVVITRTLFEALTARFDLPPEPFVTVAPDGVDLERYADLPDPQAARQDLNLPDQGAFTAGYTGGMYAGRGLELLLALAARLPEIQFLLVGGDPSECDRLREEVHERGIGNLTLRGFVPNADLPRYQAACDVLLMPYQSRVAASSGGDIAPFLSPMKLFEYLACGRPILSGDLPVLREVLDDQIAVLLPPADLDAWTAALVALQRNPLRRAALAEQARRAARGYSWDARVDNILAGLVP